MFDIEPVTTEHETACGPASLKMLLDYYGIKVPLETLIEECGVKINGCTGADLLRVGRAHGLDMLAYRMDADEVMRQDRPAICWWKFQHFIVFAGMNEKGEPVICNPSRGRYPIDAQSFASFYSDVAFFNGEPADMPDGWTVDEDIEKGAFFLHNDTVWQAVQAIPKGALAIPRKNCVRKTLNDI